MEAFYLLNKALFIVILITQMKTDISIAEHTPVFSDNTTGPVHLAYPGLVNNSLAMFL